MMDALAITRYFRANDPRRVRVVRRAVHAANPILADHFDVERADRRAIVRADGGLSDQVERRVHLKKDLGSEQQRTSCRRDNARFARLLANAT